MTETPTDGWARKDVWWGLVMFVVGAMVALYAVLAARNDVPFRFWCAGVPMGLLLLLVGGNSLYRSLRAPQ